MSAGSSGQLEVPGNQLRALSREIVWAAGNNDGEVPTALASVDCQALATGNYSRTELRRLQGLVVEYLVMRGVRPAAICQRLRINLTGVKALLMHALKDECGDVSPEMMRAISAAQADWEIEYSTERLVKTGKPEWLQQRRESRRDRNKLMGLNLPERHEVQVTKRVGIRLEVIRTREELEASEAAVLPAETTGRFLENATDGMPAD